MERWNIPYLTVHTEHKTEFHDGIKQGQSIGCIKGVVFYLKARGEKCT